MASLRGTLVVLHCIYPWLGIFGLLLALLQTPSINIVHFWNHLYILSSSFLIRFSLAVLVVTFFGTALGRMALRTNRSDKMRNFAAYVFVCLVLQVVVGGYLYPCRPFKQDTDEFVNLMRTPEEIFEFTQQPHCVGFSSPVQSDFHGALFEVPDSCCGSCSLDRDTGCTWSSELRETPGCKDVYFRMMTTLVGFLVFQTVSWVIQLLLSIFAFIHSRQLLRQNEEIPIVS